MPDNFVEFQRDIKIRALGEIEFTHAISKGLDSIFFEASSVREFASDDVRSVFRERWLGSYLSLNKPEAFLALTPSGEVAGYVVGDLEDPSRSSRYADMGYFRVLAPWTASYPAHLHMNVALQHRSMGLGARLIEAFAAHAARAGCPGVHVVTGGGMRNVGFYRRNGFVEVADAPWNGRTVVMLARRLDTATHSAN